MKQFIQNNNNYAIAYYRYSSSGQNEASIDQQRECAERFAESKGLTIIKEYADAAMTGTSADRPQYQLMLSEIGKIRPAYLIIWKTDRLGRDRCELAIAKKKIRDSGTYIHCISEAIPEGTSESIILESIIDGMAEFYSYNLSSNVKRGLKYTAENGLFYKKIYGYKKGPDKHYEIDDDTAPVVVRIFNEYASGKGMVEICDSLNAQGLTTINNGVFTVNGLRSILKNRSYIGEYSYNGIVIPDGMPQIISIALFDKAQEQLKANKRAAKRTFDEDTDEPRYWLTGKLYCGLCQTAMCGMHGTSETGRKYYYYSCGNHRKKTGTCKKKDVPKAVIENAVIYVLKTILNDTENLASLAVDISAYYKKNYNDDSYLKALESELKTTEKSLNNLVKALEQGIFSETTQNRLVELENQKKFLTETIVLEQTKQKLAVDEMSIRHFFEKYQNADLQDEQIRDTILEYFIDKIYVYDDKLVVCCYYTDSIENGYQVKFKDVEKKFDSFALCPANY